METYRPDVALSRRRRGHPQAGPAPRIHNVTTALTHGQRIAFRARAAAAGKKPAVYLYGLIVADLAREEVR